MSDNTPDHNYPQRERALYVLDAIEKRLDLARERESYEDVRVDLLAIIQHIQRNLRLIDDEFPPR